MTASTESLKRHVKFSFCGLHLNFNRFVGFLSLSALTVFPLSALIAQTNDGFQAEITQNSRIVVDKANEADSKSAADLEVYLEKITGRKVPVEDHGVPAEGRYTIAVGLNRYTEELTEELKAMDIEGFVIKSAENHLLIRGFDEKATAFGVNYFLQEYCGVRWYMPLPEPLGIVIPRREKISIGIFTDRQEPSFVIRLFHSSGEHGSEFALRNLANARRWFAHHEVNAIMNMDTYYERHPEYYAMIGGRRDAVPHWFQVCTSNPEVIQLFIDYAVRHFNTNPDATVVPMGLNDGTGYCECNECMAQGGTISDRIYTFYDTVAKGLNERHPGKKVGLIVYSGAKELPSEGVLKKIDTRNFAAGMPWDQTDWWVPKARKAHKELIRSWSERLDRFFMYGWFSLRSNTVPTMHIRDIDSMLKYAHGLGNCDGFYNETSQFYALHGPQMWVMAQLLWNIDRDVDALLKDFCNGMFGKGGSWMERYYNHIQEIWWRQPLSSVSLWGNYAGEFNLFKAEDMEKLQHYLSMAEKAADTLDTLARVKMISEVFDAVYTTWKHSRGVRESVKFTEVRNDQEALRAEKIINDIFEDQKSLEAYKLGIIERGMPQYLKFFSNGYNEYDGFKWQMDVPWLFSALIDYRLANSQQEELQNFLTSTGEKFGGFAMGGMAKGLGAISDMKSLLTEGTNLVINPFLEKKGYEVNGLNMFDWVHDDLCPAGWYRWRPEQTQHFYSMDDKDARKNIAYGIKGDNAHACYLQVLPIEPGDKFILMAKTKLSLHSGAAKANVSIQYWKDRQQWIAGGSNYTLPSGIQNAKWHQIIGFEKVPEDARYVVIGLWGQNFSDVGHDDAVLFDDIRLIKVKD